MVNRPDSVNPDVRHQHGVAPHMAKKKPDDAEKKSVKVAAITTAGVIIAALIAIIPLMRGGDDGEDRTPKSDGTVASGADSIAVGNDANIIATGGSTVNVGETPATPAELHIQRVKFADGEPHNLDILLQNRGKSAALLTKVTVQVDRIWSLFQDNNVPRRVTPSGKYTITIPVKSAPYTIEADLEQHIPADDADRILLTLSTPVDTQAADQLFQRSQFRHFVYRLQLTLTYDDGKTIAIDKPIDYLPVAEPFLEPDDDGENERVYFELSSGPETVRSTKLRELLEDRRR